MDTSSVKGFILAEKPEALPKTSKKRGKRQIQYEVTLEDGENIAITRKGRPASTLVIIPSQSLYYIDKEGEEPYLMDEDTLTKFLSDAPDDGIALNGTKWTEKLSKGRPFARNLIRFLRDYEGVIKTGFVRFDGWYPRNNCWNDSVRNLYNTDKKIFQYLVTQLMSAFQLDENELIEKINGYDSYKSRTVLEGFGNCQYLALVRALWGIDNVRKLIDAFVRTNQNMNLAIGDMVDLLRAVYDNADLDQYTYARHTVLLPDYELSAIVDLCKRELAKSRNDSHMEFDSFLNYILSYRLEGYYDLSGFVEDWTDTLRLQKAIFGKIKDKYPKNLCTQHQVLSMKSSMLNSVRRDLASMDFDDFVYSAAHLEWTPDWGSYEWSIPKTPGELIDEAEQQQNCLKGWVPELASNLRFLVFMRNKKTPDKSQLTIEVSKDGHIGEIAGFMNRAANSEEMKNIRRWAKEKRLCMPGETVPPPLDPPKQDEEEKTA